MNPLQKKLESAMEYAFSHRPKVGGFPFLAECLRLAGVERNLWTLPSAQSVYFMKEGVLVQAGLSLVTGMTDCPSFDEAALIRALRRDQAGEGSFPEFLEAAWAAGVLTYEVDFLSRRVVYRGSRGESYEEVYAAVEVGEIGI